MATASNSSGQTTRERSIVTLDGYVSRGQAPPYSVPRDYAMLQDFAAYLELRLKCVNMSMLRRIFADFLNEQENTLVPMMQQGCTIITIYPVLRTSAQRRQKAEALLAKPKHYLDARGCVFLYLQHRTATRNMALLKHLLLEFVCRRETSLMAFVERGCQVISVIPFELPQMLPPTRPPPPPVTQESPCSVDTATERQQVVSEPVVKTTTKKRKRKAVSKASTVSASADDADVAAPVATQKKTKGKQKQQPEVSISIGESEARTKRRRRSRESTTRKSTSAPPASNSAAELTPKRSRRTRASTAPPQDATSAAVPEPVVSTLKRGRKTKATTASPQDATSVATAAEVGSVVAEVVSSSAKSAPSRETDTVPLHEAASLATSEPVEPRSIKTAKSTIKRGRKPKTPLQYADSESATETVESAATEAQPAAKSTPTRGKQAMASPLPQQEADSVAATDLADPATMDTANSTPKRGKKSNSSSENPLDATPPAVSELVAPAVAEPATSTLKRGRKAKPRTTSLQHAATESVLDVVQSVLNDLVSRVSGEVPVLKQHRKRKSEAEKLKASEGKSRKRSKAAGDKPAKRGKPVMSEEMCRSQLDLARKMEAFEAQIPWEAAYNNLSPPFDEVKHPTLALKFRKFWLKHTHAVWEREFWAPMSRKLNLAEFNKRNNRQLAAKNAFESLIICAYEELGAEFFVKLDSQKPRHPGWWYRGPVVALFALQQMKGEDAMWEYVMNQALKRFPDCNLPLPLSASNSGAMRIRHKRESVSMWIANHQQTAGILEEMAAIKAQEEAGTVEASGELESSGTDSVAV